MTDGFKTLLLTMCLIFASFFVYNVYAHAGEDGGADASVTAEPGPTADSPEFFKLLVAKAQSAEWFPFFVLAIMGIVELVRRPFVLKMIPFLKTSLGSHLQVGLTALGLAWGTTAMAGGKLTVTILLFGLAHGVCAALGWKVPDLFKKKEVQA